MKQLLIAALMAVSLVSCSSNDDNTTPQQAPPVQTQYFHPPAWIIGSWKVGNTSYFKFTNDNFIYVMNGTSYKEILQQTASTGQTAKVNEQISDLYYEFTIIAGTSNGQYKFKKISDTKIQWVGSSTIFLDKE